MTTERAPLTLHPDRLLPVDGAVRPIAGRLHAAVQDLAGLVAAHRLDEAEALDTLIRLVSVQPRKVFKL
jgi:hypothetical protein